MTDRIPSSIDPIDGTWLSAALGREVTIAGAPEPLSSFACRVYRLRLHGAGDVIVKLPIEGELRPLIDGLGIYRREIAFYDRVAPVCPLRTPVAHVARIAQTSTDFVLVIEDVGPTHASDQLDGLTLAEAGVVVDELAAFHRWSWDSPLLTDVADVFPPLDSPAGRAMQARWGQFFGVGWAVAEGLAGDALTPEVAAFAARFPEHLDRFIDELSAPRVLSHGELRADNMVFPPDGRPYVIDFQNAQQECGPRELAYFLVQSLTTDARRGNDEALVGRYWSALGVDGYEWELAWRQYRLGAAHQLMMTVVAAMRYEAVEPRAQALLREMVRRAVSAVDDLGSLELLAEGH